MKPKGLRLVGAVCVLLLSAARGASAQPAPPQVNQNCTVSVLNRTVTANPDGTWILPNVPANFGPVRARVTCIVDGQTISGETDPFTVPANGVVNIPQVHFGQTTPIPRALTIGAPTGPLTQAGETRQLVVTALYPDGSMSDVTPANAGTTYTVSNAAIATISGDGLLQAVSSGTVIVQATQEGASGMRAFQVALAGTDSDGDGIPDDAELQLGMNPNNPVDAQEDFDRDNLTNLQEYQLGTNLRAADSDGDGLKDGDEVSRGTGPLIRDSDGDGISDGLEVQTASNPLDANNYSLAGALESVAVVPPVFTLTFNTIAGDVSVQLTVTGTLIDGATIDLTSTQRGTNYSSSDLTICSFDAAPGRVFAGMSGGCTVTASVGGFKAEATGTVTTFAPTPLSSVDLGGPGNGVDVAGDFAYVAAGGAGLKVVNVTNRSAPQLAATLGLLGNANDVKLAGTRAFVAAGAAGLHVVDVSNPLVPRLLGSVDTPGNAVDVRVRGNLAYVADGPNGLQVVDVTNAGSPRIVGAVATGPTANGVDVEDTIAVVAAGAAGVQIVNVANPASPVVVGAVDTPGDALDVVVRGSHAFVADYTGSIRGVDFTTPTAPVLGGTLPANVGGYLLDIALMDTLTFGADIFFVNGVPITDVTDVHNPRSRPRIDFPGDATGLGIAVDGSHVYLGTDTSRLYIGQYRIQQDLNGIPPSVSIASPGNGAAFVERETISVAVVAADDLGVASVTLEVDGMPVETDSTAPYLFNVVAPVGATSLDLAARAVDLGNNEGVATVVRVNVIPDPLTTATGRVVLQNGSPVAGAGVSCLTQGAVTPADGTFSIAGVPTIHPAIVCTASFMTGDGTALRGISGVVPAVRGGTTLMGDLRIAPVPVITSITPKVIDALLPPASLRVTGANLAGAAFAFVPDLPTTLVAGTPQVNAEGTSATLPITVGAAARGRFTLVGTNNFGGADPTPTGGNTLTIINTEDEVDGDGDGFPDAMELLLGSDQLDPASVPNPDAFRIGEVEAQPVSVVNAGAAPGPPTTQEADATPFSTLNLVGVSGGQPVQMEVDGVAFSVVNADPSAPIQAQTEAGGSGGSGGQGGSGGATGQSTPMEADAIVFSVNNLAPSAPGAAVQAKNTDPPDSRGGQHAVLPGRPLIDEKGVVVDGLPIGTRSDDSNVRTARRQP